MDAIDGTENTIDAIGAKVLYDADPSFSVVDGLLHNAIRLGTAGLELTPASDAFNFITSAFSVAFWVKRSAGTATVALTYDAGTGPAWLFQVNETSVNATLDGAGAGWGAQDTVTLSSDAWHFVCLRFDAANVYLNVNDRAEVSDSATSCGDQTGGTLTVLPAGAGTMDIDNLMISKAGVCWSDDQVRKLYNGGLGREVR
jgi:hypothetical protein